MKTVRISDEVYQEIAKRGHFGETVDDVLRREFSITGEKRRTVAAQRQVLADRTMTPKVSRNGDQDVLRVSFEDGTSQGSLLSYKNDRHGFRSVLQQVLQFAEREGATEGQLKYIRKELNRAGYYVHGPRL